MRALRLSVSRTWVRCEVCGLRVTASPGLARHQSNALVCSTRASARNQAGYFREQGFEYVHPGWATEAAMALLREHGVEIHIGRRLAPSVSGGAVKDCVYVPASVAAVLNHYGRPTRGTPKSTKARVCATYLRCAIACHKDPTVALAFDSALKMDAGRQFISQYAAPDAAHALAEGKGEAP